MQGKKSDLGILGGAWPLYLFPLNPPMPATYVNSAFHLSGVGKSSTSQSGWG